MNVREINEHFLSRADWIDREKTVDRIILGDPEKEIRRVLVTWISSFAAVRAAVEGGFDMLMTHEPTFWTHRNEHENMDTTDLARAKKRFAEDRGLAILRNHDVWDRFPGVGIPWAWGRFLELGERPTVIHKDRFQHRYDIAPVRLDELASRIAAKTAAIGEPLVQVKGDGGMVVSKVGIGTGCCDRIDAYREIGCDVSVVCDDGSAWWSMIQRAADDGHPVIRVNHGTSEEPGMVTLTQHINDNLSGVEAVHLPHGSCFRLVGA